MGGLPTLKQATGIDNADQGLKDSANLATFGAYEGATAASKGDLDTAGKSLATGGLSSVDRDFNDGKITAAVGNLNPFKKASVPGLPDVDPTGIQGAVTQPSVPSTLAAGHVTVPTADNSGYNQTTIAVTPGPTAATLQGLDNNDFRAAQLSTIQQLQNQAAGVGPSIAENQIRQSQDANTAQAYALANSARGGFNPAMARAALQAGASNNAVAAQQAGQARLQEQLQAAGVLGTIASTGRGQDIDISKSNAANVQQANMAGFQGGVQTAIAQGQLNADQAKTLFTAAQQAGITNAQMDTAFNELQAKYAQMGMTAQMANQQAALQLQQLIQSGAIAKQNAATAANGQKNAMMGALIGAGGMAAGAMIGGPAGAAVGGQLAGSLAGQSAGGSLSPGTDGEQGVVGGPGRNGMT